MQAGFVQAPKVSGDSLSEVEALPLEPTFTEPTLSLTFLAAMGIILPVFLESPALKEPPLKQSALLFYLTELP